MIFVTLGTTKYPFERPLKIIEKLVKSNEIEGDVIVQTGYTEYSSSELTLKKFFTPDEIEELYQKADFIISHGGTGSIMKGLYLNKKVLVIPRLKKFNEHIDDHQLEVSGELERKGHIMVWHEKENLKDKLKLLESFEPVPYQGKNDVIIDYLKDSIDKW